MFLDLISSAENWHFCTDSTTQGISPCSSAKHIACSYWPMEHRFSITNLRAVWYVGIDLCKIKKVEISSDNRVRGCTTYTFWRLETVFNVSNNTLADSINLVLGMVCPFPIDFCVSSSKLRKSLLTASSFMECMFCLRISIKRLQRSAIFKWKELTKVTRNFTFCF